MNEPYQVLYIDDDKMLLDLGKIYLERQDGFQVAVTTSAQEVLESLHSGRYDAIISDYEMPGMNGIELLKAVRNQDPAFPFILFTGKGREDVVIEALNNGADFYLQKGGEPKSQFAELSHKVRQAIILKRIGQSLKISVQELSQASTRYAALIAASHTGAWEYHSDTGYLWCSPEYFSMLGRDISEYNLSGGRNIEETWITLLHPDDRIQASLKFDAYLKQPDGMYEQYFRMLHADGHYIWIWSRGKTILDDTGTPTSVTVGTHIDITERKQQETDLQRSHDELQTAYDVIARTGEDLRENLDKLTVQEQALRESEEKFRTFFESAGDAIFILDNGVIYDCNHQTETLFRRSKERLIGKTPSDLAPVQQPGGKRSDELAKEKRDDSKKGTPVQFEYVHQYPDRTEFFAEVTLQEIRMQGRMFQQAIVRDISERKRNESELLKKNEELHTAYEEIFSAEAESRANQQFLIEKDVELQQTKNQLDDIISFLPDATFVISRDGTVIAWNRAMEEMTGILAGQIIGQGDYAYALPFYEEKRPMLIDLALSWDQNIADRYLSISKNGDLLTSEISLPHFKGGNGGFFWFTACPFYDPDGNVIGAIECIRDITSRKITEQALEKRLIALTRPLEDTSISFEDLFDISEIQRLQDEFASATGVASIITKPDGTPITRPSNFTRLCSEIIRKTDKGCENCYRSDAILGSPHPEGPVVQPCSSGGLWDAGAGIVVGNRHIANWLIGQVRDETQTEEVIRIYAREIGADEVDAVAAYHEVPSMPEKQFRLIAQCLFSLAHQLSNSAYQNVQQARFITNQRQAEDALKESENRLDQAMAVKNEGYWDWDLITYETFFDDRYYTMAGYEPHEFPQDFSAWSDHVHPDDLPGSNAAITDYLSGKSERFDIEFRFKHKGGYWIWIRGRGKIVERDIHGSPIRMIGTHTDITERRFAESELLRKHEELSAAFEEISATEEELRSNLDDMARQEKILNESKAFLFRQNLLFSTLLDNLTVGVFMIAAPGGIPLVANKAAREMLGRGVLPDATGENLSEVYQAYKKGSKDPYPVAELPIIRGMYGEHAHIDDMVVRRPDGSEIQLDVHGTPIYDENGAITASLVSFSDITELKKGEDLLRASYEQIAATEEELRHQYEELARTQEILQRNQHQLEDITKSVPGVIYQFYAKPDGTMGLNFVSSRAPEVLGISSNTSDFFERFTECVDIRDRDEFLYSNADAIKTGQPWHYEGRFNKPSGDQIWFKGISRPVRDGSELIFNGILLDITDRKLAEEKARQDLARQQDEARVITRLGSHPDLAFGRMNNLIKDLTEAAGQVLQTERTGVWFFEKGGSNLVEVDTFISSPHVHTSGAILREEEYQNEFDTLKREKFIDASDAMTDPRVSGYAASYFPINHITALLDAVIRVGNTTLGVICFEHVDIRHQWQPDEVTFACQLADQIALAVSNCHLIQTTDALKETNKKLNLLSSVTRHDILNKISVQLGLFGLALEMADEEPELSEYIRKTESAAEDIKNQIEFTRVYQDFGTHEPQWQDLHRILIKISVPEELSVSDDCAGTEIFADSIFEKVIQNLVENAIRHGGTVTKISMTAKEADSTLIIRLEDNGIGIPKDEKEKIFERGYGKNTGLGLFLAREILAITGITIRETGEPGKGARFEILVPEGKWRDVHLEEE